MQIIPVIDVMGVIVVHAAGGVRGHYQPLQSVLTSSCEPMEVITALLDMHNFKTIYIADLDAISHNTYDLGFYANLNILFPDVEFYLDAGIRTRKDWQKIAAIKGICCVLGSETLEEIDLLKELEIKDRGILSLDYKQDRFLGQSALMQQPKIWPKTVMVMNLDRVGTELGPDYALLAKVAQRVREGEVIAAGGVRRKEDLDQLAKQGITATLVASALHKGNISSEELKNF